MRNLDASDSGLVDSDAAFGQYFLKVAVRYRVADVKEHRMQDHRFRKQFNNRIEGSHRPTRKREKVMGRFGNAICGQPLFCKSFLLCS